jgi:hypothetical protein
MRKNKLTEDSMNPNYICEERRPNGNKHGHRHKENTLTAFEYERSLQQGEFRM